MPVSVVSGDGRAHEFVRLASADLTAALPFSPYPGTLNLAGYIDVDGLPTDRLTEVGDDYCAGVDLHHCRVNGIRAAVIVPDVPGYPPEKIEVLAPTHLRTLFGLTDGDHVTVTSPDADALHTTDGVRFDPDALDGFDGVVFDFDGTLVDLAVDWDAVRGDLLDLLGPHLSKPIDEYHPVGLHEVAVEIGERESYRARLAAYEREAVDASTPRPLLSALSALDCPVGVRTLTATETARCVLERFEAAGAVDVVVGRETTDEPASCPQLLRTVLSTLDVAPGDAVFVGDDPRDAETAVNARSSYLHPAWALM